MLKLINDRRSDEKGFTLAELLIVVAIIAVLIAISIPIFTKRLEASRETTDLANLRSAYAAGQVAVLAGDVSDGSYKYSSSDPTGLVSGTGDILGKGTATEGGTTTSGMPSCISYSQGTIASGQDIVVSISGGVVSTVQFAG